MSKEKKYRFYFSQKQSDIDEEMWNMPTRFVFVKTPNGYKQYSELCSIKGTRCNWEDSELVYEADEMPEIIVHEAIPELIAELEAKLAESEKENERIRKNWQISKTHQQKLYNNLKQQNKEKGIVNYPITLDGCRIANEEQLLDFAKDFCLEKKSWKKQLAEKDQTIESLQEINQSLGQTCNNDAKEIERLREQLKLAKMGESFEQEKKNKALNNQNQTAIAELEKVVEFMKTRDEWGFFPEQINIAEYIAQQINDLRSK